MHQHPRIPARVGSPAPTPQTDPTRTNNPREATPVTRARATSNALRGEAVGPLGNEDAHGLPIESIKKLDQIIQNFFLKVFVVLANSRITVNPTRSQSNQLKLNKWFQLDTHDIEDFKEELKLWKTCGTFDNRPPPLIIEVFLDTSQLKHTQTLVITDDDGKDIDVLEELNPDSMAGSDSARNRDRISEVVLERWRVELDVVDNLPTDDFGPILPTIYKKAIVFFRALFSCAGMLPTWKFATHSVSRRPHPSLLPQIRIRGSEWEGAEPDRLRMPIGGRSDAVTDYEFGDLEVPVGRLRTSVTYRSDCNFRVDDAEALISSRFMGIDEDFFKPSLPQSRERPRAQVAEVGSLRDHRQRRNRPDVQQTYGSLSTFHGAGALGTSPISALRAVKQPGSDTSSPPSSFPKQDIDIPNSLPIRASTTRPSLRGDDVSGRRTSISFQPFKAGSLSGSPIPRQADSESPASPHSLNRPGGPPSLTQPRNRTSLTAGMPASLRGGPVPIPTSDPAAPGSPRPGSTSRYSSSFTHRRGRPSLGGTSRMVDDEQTSSGRQSLASSIAQPGSGLLAEPGGSSGSFQDDDNIQKFLEALESKRTLQTFEPTKRGESATNKTVAQLSKFHQMRESNNALTDSMTSSMQMQRSSSSSSRQLPSVPGMASASVSSSPGGKPHSPHTPHTPAIPSRLSEQSTADQAASQGRVSSRQARPSESTVPEASRESTITQDNAAGAIDIPLSPRLTGYQRRSNSVAQQSRAQIEDEADLPFATNRSVSLGADDREPPTMSGLLGRQLAEESASQISGPLQPAADIQTAESSSVLPRGCSDDPPSDGFMSAIPSSSPFGRRRYAGMGAGKRQTPPQSSRGSFTGSGSRLRGDDESLNEEPLMFDLSEMDAQGRRSLEENKGVGHPNRRGAW